MTAQILDGNALAKSIRSDLKADIAQWHKDGFRAPGLAVILVGNDPASEVYVNGKRHVMPQGKAEQTLLAYLRGACLPNFSKNTSSRH